MDVAILVLRHTAIALGDDGGFGARGMNAHDGGHQFRCADAAIGANGGGLHRQTGGERAEGLGGDAHHGAAIGVEAHGGDHGKASARRPFHGGAKLFFR